MTMNSNLNDLQKKLIPMMGWFHNYCVSHNLRYYALGGTMLGAVRHNGFIPWDDDIDVGLPREDYNQLVKQIGNRKIENYYLETPESEAKEYRYPYSKLYDTTTTLTENTWPKLRRGIFMDVFPLDGFGNSEEECLKNWKLVLHESNFMWARTCAVRKERAPIKNLAIILAHLIPDNLAKDKHRLYAMNKKAQRRSFDEMEYSGNTFGNWGLKEIMASSIMGKPRLYMFENLRIYGAEDYEAYLTHMYGNWRQLPPVEKRITHHDYVKIDLNASYLK